MTAWRILLAMTLSMVAVFLAALLPQPVGLLPAFPLVLVSLLLAQEDGAKRQTKG